MALKENLPKEVHLSIRLQGRTSPTEAFCLFVRSAFDKIVTVLFCSRVSKANPEMTLNFLFISLSVRPSNGVPPEDASLTVWFCFCMKHGQLTIHHYL